MLPRGEVDFERNLQKAKTLMAKAIELQPDLAEAHRSKGLMLLVQLVSCEIIIGSREMLRSGQSFSRS